MRFLAFVSTHLPIGGVLEKNHGSLIRLAHIFTYLITTNIIRIEPSFHSSESCGQNRAPSPLDVELDYFSKCILQS